MALYERLATGQVEANHQAQASIFKLPLEVRSEIYDLVYPEHLLHIMNGPRRKGGPYCNAYWCVAIDDYAKGYSHTPCAFFQCPRKEMLGLPMACRRLYVETIQRLYSRHTFHFISPELAVEWQRRTPQAHLDAVTSVRLSGVDFDSSSIEEYKAAWDFLASFPSLEEVAVRISNCDTHEGWDPTTQRDMSAPIQKIQQSTIQSFDVIYDIGPTWFPDDYYMRLDYNGLGWDTFTFDRDMFPDLFDGLHPRCRVIGMNGFIFNRPVRDDMPTTAQLNNWISWFSCNSAYGADLPPGYSFEEAGERYLAAARARAQEAAAAGLTEDEYQAEQTDRARTDRDNFERCHLCYDSDDGCVGDPMTWDLVELNRIAEALDSADRWPRLGRWNFPEKPSWIEYGTLERPHEFPELVYGSGSEDEEDAEAAEEESEEESQGEPVESKHQV